MYDNCLIEQVLIGFTGITKLILYSMIENFVHNIPMHSDIIQNVYTAHRE